MVRWKKGAKEQLPKQVAEFLERPIAILVSMLTRHENAIHAR